MFSGILVSLSRLKPFQKRPAADLLEPAPLPLLLIAEDHVAAGFVQLVVERTQGQRGDLEIAVDQEYQIATRLAQARLHGMVVAKIA
jgi:hypothetical protein